MVSSRIVCNMMNELHEITRTEISLWDKKGTLLVSTDPEEKGERPENQGKRMTQEMQEFLASPADSQVLQNRHFFKIYKEETVAYLLVTRGNDAYLTGRIAVSEIRNLLLASRVRLDKDHFMQELLSGQLQERDLREKAGKLRIEERTKRALYVARTKEEKDAAALETIRMLFGAETGYFVVEMDDHHIVLVGELKGKEPEIQLQQTAHTLVDTLNMEAMSSVRVAYGTPAQTLRDLPRAYQEARMALEVGRIFYSDRKVISYENLGLGRLIYQLPQPLCQLFLQETLKGKTLADLDEETLTIIRRFFENNLNISETARQLYLHRNTLVYRLEKIEKQLGLDIRRFEEALTLKIAMMVESYLKDIRENPGSTTKEETK